MSAGCAAAVVLLAGCTSGGSGGTSQARSDEQAGGGNATTSTSAPGGAEQDPAGPLEAFLGFRVSHRPGGLETAVPALNPDSAGPSEDDRRDQLRLEQMIGACMRAEGFEYVVRDPFAGPGADPRQSPYALPRHEFATQFGYGISTIDVPDATEVDPNYAALASMKPAERQAYLWALDGGAEQGDTENTGCRGRAVKEIFGRSTVGGAAGPGLEPFADLVEEIQTLTDRVDSDPRVARDAAQRWADCMADAGHPGLAKPSDASDSVRTRLAQTRAGKGDGAALAEVRRYEVALAGADLRCRAGYDTARRQVRDELERAFVDDHRAELQRYKEAMGQSAG